MELALEEIEALEPTYYGPTWRRREGGEGFDLPKKSLGLAILFWCAQYLNNFDGTPTLKLTREQARFIMWWYALDDNGRFIYNRGVLQRVKGAGKDPLLAVIALVEFLGPCRFGGWDANGDPIAVPVQNAWVQITAVNQSQTTNTMALMPTLMSERLRAEFGIKDGAELIRAKGGRLRLEAVTSSYRAIEGKRTTFTLLNETQHWVSGNNGIQMYETIDGNATKMSARYLAITNAYLPGEDSVAERMRETYEKILDGRAIDFGFMYDSIEAHPDTPLTPDALRIVLPKLRGDAVWLDPESVIKSIMDMTISPARSRRMHLNQVIASEDALYGPGQIERLKVDAMLKAGDEIVMGFDGGKTDDATALVAIRIRDGVAFVLGLWQKPEAWPSGPDAPRWEVPRSEVDSAVHRAFRVYEVRGFYADVALWESYIAEWTEQYGEKLAIKATQVAPIAWDMRQSLQRVTRAHERLVQTIFDAKIHYDGDRDLRRHMLNVRRRENAYGVSFGKESRESPNKVDLYAALLLAHEALTDYRTRGKKPDTQGTQGWFL